MTTDTTRRAPTVRGGWAGYRTVAIGDGCLPFLKDQGFAAETFGDLAPYGNAGFLDAVLTLMAAAGLGRALPVATTRERPALAT